MQNPSTIHSNPIKTLIILLLICFILLASHLTEKIAVIKKFMFYVIAPSATSASAVVNYTSQSLNSVKAIVAAREENVLLKDIVNKQICIAPELDQLRQENARLREVVGFNNQPNNEVLIARVLSRDSDGWYQWITVNKGLKDGVVANVAVLAIANSQPCVLGRVYEVLENSSKIILITNPLFSVPAKLKNANRDALIEGLNNGYLSARFLKDESVAVLSGDEVITSALSSVFPQGFKIGTISSVQENPEESTLVALVKPAINLNDVSETIILLPKESKSKK